MKQLLLFASVLVLFSCGDSNGSNDNFTGITASTEILAGGLTAGVQYGSSVAMDNIGTSAVVGAPYYSTDGTIDNQFGSAYLWRKGSSGWQMSQMLLASDAEDDSLFGVETAISADGTTILVGASGADSGNGKAYLFSYSGYSLIQAKDFFGATGSFGSAVALSGDGSVAVIGAPFSNFGNPGAGEVIVYRNSDWQDSGATTYMSQLGAPDTQATGYFGWSVAVDSTGDTVAVGARYDDERGTQSGCVFVFQKPDSSSPYALLQRITAQDTGASDQLGMDIDLSDDGKTLVAGNSRDKAYIFHDFEDGFGYVQVALLEPDSDEDKEDFGLGVAISGDGSTVLISDKGYNHEGITNAGRVYIWHGGSFSWTRIADCTVPLNPAFYDYFGTGIAASENGTSFLVGAYSVDPAGDAWVFGISY